MAKKTIDGLLFIFFSDIIIDRLMTASITNLAIYFKNVSFQLFDGFVRYASVGAIPSVQVSEIDPYKLRIWNFNITALLKPVVDNKYTIFIDGSNINPKPASISFEGELTGNISYKGKVLDANYYMKYEWNDSDPYKITLLFTLPCAIKKETLINLNININDSALLCSCFGCTPGCGCSGDDNICEAWVCTNGCS